jgi:hypothetical protein
MLHCLSPAALRPVASRLLHLYTIAGCGSFTQHARTRSYPCVLQVLYDIAGHTGLLREYSFRELDLDGSHMRSPSKDTLPKETNGVTSCYWAQTLS